MSNTAVSGEFKYFGFPSPITRPPNPITRLFTSMIGKMTRFQNLSYTPCRLKDINEMFYDTGIGKEGYSIIGQGQIDKILSGKPEERRELFDEAAGIVKFKPVL